MGNQLSQIEYLEYLDRVENIFNSAQDDIADPNLTLLNKLADKIAKYESRQAELIKWDKECIEYENR